MGQWLVGSPAMVAEISCAVAGKTRDGHDARARVTVHFEARERREAAEAVATRAAEILERNLERADAAELLGDEGSLARAVHARLSHGTAPVRAIQIAPLRLAAHLESSIRRRPPAVTLELEAVVAPADDRELGETARPPASPFAAADAIAPLVRLASTQLAARVTPMLVADDDPRVPAIRHELGVYGAFAVCEELIRAGFTQSGAIGLLEEIAPRAFDGDAVTLEIGRYLHPIDESPERELGRQLAAICGMDGDGLDLVLAILAPHRSELRVIVGFAHGLES